MTAPALARLTSVLVVAGGASTLGHVLRPFVPGTAAAELWHRAGFVLAVAALGAWRGRRELLVRAAWDEVRLGAGRARAGAAVGAVAALLASALGYVAVHGLSH